MLFSRKWIGALCLTTAGGLMAPAIAQTAVESATGQATVDRNQPATTDRPTDPSQTLPATVPRAGAQTVPGVKANHAADLNKQIAVWILLGNEEEVALGKLAEQKAQHPEVKKFAQQMVQHHQQVISKIQQVAPETAGHNLQLKSKTATRETATTQPSNTGVQLASAESPVGGQQASHDQQGVALAQAIKQECLNLTEQELSQKQGVEFDKAYVGQQIAAHMGMLAQLRGSRSFAHGELQPVIDEGERMTQQHLDQAKQIMAQLKDKQGPAVTQNSPRPATTTQPTR